VSDKNAGSILQSEDALCCRDIFLEGRFRLLHEADVVSVFDENVVNASPARAIGPGAVDQNNISNVIVSILVVALRRESAAAQ
jgi:hypothetical protein